MHELAWNRFSEQVEAVRIGLAIHDSRRNLARWRSLQARMLPGRGAGPALRSESGGGLTGGELEQVLMAMRLTSPDIIGVKVGKPGKVKRERKAASKPKKRRG